MCPNHIEVIMKRLSLIKWKSITIVTLHYNKITRHNKAQLR